MLFVSLLVLWFYLYVFVSCFTVSLPDQNVSFLRARTGLALLTAVSPRPRTHNECSLNVYQMNACKALGQGLCQGKKLIRCGFWLHDAYSLRDQAKIFTILDRIGCVLREGPCHSLRAREERRGKDSQTGCSSFFTVCFLPWPGYKL